MQLFSLQGGGGSGPALNVAEQTCWKANGLTILLSPPPAFHPVSPTAVAKHPMGIGYWCWSSLLEMWLWAPWDGGQVTTESQDLVVKYHSAKKCYLHKRAQKSLSQGLIFTNPMKPGSFCYSKCCIWLFFLNGRKGYINLFCSSPEACRYRAPYNASEAAHLCQKS